MKRYLTDGKTFIKKTLNIFHYLLTLHILIFDVDIAKTDRQNIKMYISYVTFI